MNIRSTGKGGVPSVCVVAIVKDEEPFIDEWLCYHRMIGVDHFYLYDNGSAINRLADFVLPHQDYVTVVEWHPDDKYSHVELNQLRAYSHAVHHCAHRHDWVAFIDIDEYIVLRRHAAIGSFMSTFSDCTSVSLNWIVFGHNGYYQNPTDLITSALVRRMRNPSVHCKSITRTEAIEKIESPHYCVLRTGRHADANGKAFTPHLYPGRTNRAHINHYQCRSFQNWMRRASRGDVNFNARNAPPEQKWRLDYETCLEKFVTTVALDKNEHLDLFMKKHGGKIRRRLRVIDRARLALENIAH